MKTADNRRLTKELEDNRGKLPIVTGKSEHDVIEKALRESEKRYRDLYEEAPCIYLSVGTDGRIQEANRRAGEVYGYPEQLLGRQVFDLCADTKDGRVKAAEIFRKFLAGEEIRNEEVQMQNANGRRIWISLSVRPIRDAEGKIIASRSVSIDITDRVETEEALRQSQESYRELYEMAPNAYLTIGIDARIKRANRKAFEMFGAGGKELIGLEVYRLHPPEGQEKARDIYRRFLAGEQIESEEIFLADVYGKEGWVSLSLKPIRNSEGEVVEALCISIDITARKLAEAALRQSEERLAGILESAMDAIVTVDDQMRILIFNAAAVRAFRCPASHAIGKSIDLFLSERSCNLLRTFLSKIESQKESSMWAPVGMEAIRFKGENFPIEATVSQSSLAGRKIYTIILRDIYEKKQAEAQLRKLQEENLYLREEIESQIQFGEIIGTSPAIKEVLRYVGIVADTDSTVLITGETGTGKELIARAIHDQSKRKNKPLIKVNCAALPAGLIESELFGHEKGAFTGALYKKIGRFELADKGTIFLDEIGEIPLEVQLKLLRVLQEGEFERVGGTQSIKVDVRVISATNRDLQKSVEENKFRADLFYRLNVFPVHLPPLRERKEDIPLLVRYFLNKHRKRIGKRIDNIDPETMKRIASYHWPGNIRELENLTERAMILSKGPALEVPEMPSLPRREDPNMHALTMDQAERLHILNTLAKTEWIIEGPRGAARILNLHPNTLRSRMKKLGVKRPATLA